MKRYNPNIHHRHSVRLKTYDYAQEGLYFITICVKNHLSVFGNITKNNMELNEIGEIVCNEWLKTAELRSNVQLHNFVVMPNHFHGILEITRRGVACNALACNALACNAPTCNVPTCNVPVGNALACKTNIATNNIETNNIATMGVARNAPTDNTTTNEYMSSISPKSGEMGVIVRAFKSAVTKNIRFAGYDFEWQRNFYEHIIRDYDDYSRIANYIANNPKKWEDDCFFVV